MNHTRPQGPVKHCPTRYSLKYSTPRFCATHHKDNMSSTVGRKIQPQEYLLMNNSKHLQKLNRNRCFFPKAWPWSEAIQPEQLQRRWYSVLSNIHVVV